MKPQACNPHSQFDKLVIYLIKPSRYDDDGYVMRHFRGVLPSNTLACLYGLTEELRRTKRLGEMEIRTEMIDETVHRVPIKKIIRTSHKKRVKALACFVGVQTNQFPRATDLALQLRAAGVDVLIGGFHVSGMLAMFPDIPQDLQHLMDCGVTIVKGEIEEHWGDILADVCNGRLEPLYDYLDDLPDLLQPPLPRTTKKYLRKFAFPNFGTIDCSRGCPFNCSFCTIINVQGRKVRYRDAKKIGETLRENYKAGINFYFFTDDNFARNKNWEAIFDEIIRLRQDQGIHISFMMQVDVLSYKIKGFIEKAKAAGCSQVFIGMESTNPDNLAASGKTQNDVEDFKNLVSAWRSAGVSTHVGFIIGFPFDTADSVRRDLVRLTKEIKVDQASFFMMTPLPGSADHKRMVLEGCALDTDYNNYDSFHEAMPHPHLKNGAWTKLYRECWQIFYGFENMKAILQRASKNTYWNIFSNFIWYKATAMAEGHHPMVAGFFQIKNRKDRRPGFPIESRWVFYKKRVVETFQYLQRIVALMFEMQELWLQTRQRTPFEIKLVDDLDRLKGTLKDTLTVLEWQRSAAVSRFRAACSRLNIFSLKKWNTRHQINQDWRRLYIQFKKGKWYRISPGRVVANALREAKLALYFAHSLIAQIKARSPVRRIASARKETVTISLGLPDKFSELKSSLEAFCRELDLKIVRPKPNLESLLDGCYELLHRGGSRAEGLVSEYLDSLKGKADYIVLPLVKEFEQYHQVFMQGVRQRARELSARFDRLPTIINLPLPDLDANALQERLTQLGLLFTDDMTKIQAAYERANLPEFFVPLRRGASR